MISFPRVQVKVSDVHIGNELFLYALEVNLLLTDSQ